MSHLTRTKFRARFGGGLQGGAASRRDIMRSKTLRLSNEHFITVGLYGPIRQDCHFDKKKAPNGA